MTANVAISSPHCTASFQVDSGFRRGHFIQAGDGGEDINLQWKRHTYLDLRWVEKTFRLLAALEGNRTF